MRRPTLSMAEREELLDELFSSSLISRRTSQRGLRTRDLKMMDDQRWMVMSRVRVAEVNLLYSFLMKPLFVTCADAQRLRVAQSSSLSA